MEELKEALRRLLREDREFLRDLILGAISGDSSVAEWIVKLILGDPRARAELLGEIARGLAIPLNVATKDDIRRLEAAIEDVKLVMVTKEDLKQFATKEDLKQFVMKEDLKQLATKEDLRQFATKEDLKQFATKEDLKQFATKEDLKQFATKEDLKQFATKEDLERAIKRIEDKMATKEQIEDITMTVEEEARETVKWLLQQRGIRCEPQRLFLDSDYEFDVYCATDGLTIVGEAKVRVGPNVVERLAARVDEAVRRWPDRFRGRVIKVLYCLLAHPTAIDRARELGVWLIENLRERTPMP